VSERLIDIAERALHHAAGPALVQVRHARGLHVPFGPRHLGTPRNTDEVRVDVLCLCDGRAGTATVSSAGEAAIRDAVRLADATARSPAAPAHAGLPDPVQPDPHHGFDAATAELDPEVACAAARAALKVSGAVGAEVLGVVELADTAIAVASSVGARLTDRLTRAAVSVAGHGTTAGDAAVSVAGIDAGAVAGEALVRTAGLEEAELPDGRYTIVFGPRAVAQILDALGASAFNGLTYAEGRGALQTMLGTQVAAAAINLSDAPRSARTLPRAFDAEGVPKAPFDLIRDGIAHGVVHDARSAALAGTTTTGHALAPGGVPTGPRPTNLVLLGGAAGDEGELSATIERGLLVPSFATLDLLDDGTARVGGVTRGALLIEDGIIRRPARDVRVRDDALRILMATEELGAHQRLVLRGDGSGIVCPPLRAAGVPVAA